MTQPYNGMPANELTSVVWRKSQQSNPSGNCVELAELPGGTGIAMRNSRHPYGPALIYTTEELSAFILGSKSGEFDHLIDTD